MARSLKKGQAVDEKLIKKILKAKEAGDSKPIRTWSRYSTVSPEMVGAKLSIHNGKDFIDIIVTERMVGHKLGEFAPTRTFRGHSSGKIAKARGSTGRVLTDD